LGEPRFLVSIVARALLGKGTLNLFTGVWQVFFLLKMPTSVESISVNIQMNTYKNIQMSDKFN